MPEPAGFSTAVPMTGHLDIGAAILFVDRIEKLKPGALVKLNCTVADAPEPVIRIEPALILSGVMTMAALVDTGAKATPLRVACESTGRV